MLLSFDIADICELTIPYERRSIIQNEIIIHISILHYFTLFYIKCYFTLNDRRATRAAEKVQKRISNRKMKLYWFIFKIIRWLFIWLNIWFSIIINYITKFTLIYLQILYKNCDRKDVEEIKVVSKQNY